MQRFKLFIKSLQFVFKLIGVREYIDHINKLKPVHLRQRGYLDVHYGGIALCNDIFGMEVSILYKGLVDCHYRHYGITREEGKELFNAILSKVKLS